VVRQYLRCRGVQRESDLRDAFSAHEARAAATAGYERVARPLGCTVAATARQ
jgi:hypothetical protein